MSYNSHTTRQSNAPSLRVHVQVIEDYISSLGGGSVFTTIEMVRFNYLKDACFIEDWYFVSLHQIFYLWRLDPHELYGIPELGKYPRIIEAACKILDPIMQHPSAPVRRQHAKWFSEFPICLSGLSNMFDWYHTSGFNVVKSFGKLVEDWGNYKTCCKQRGYPPLVDELVRAFAVSSPILQLILFLDIRSAIGILDDEYAKAMKHLFDHDIQWHRELSVRRNTARPLTEGEIKEKNIWLAKQYEIIHVKQQKRRSMILESNSPHGIPSPAHGSPYVRPAQPHQVSGQVPPSTMVTSSSQLTALQYQNQALAHPHLQNVQYGSFSRKQPESLRFSRGQFQNAQHGASTTWNDVFSGNPLQPSEFSQGGFPTGQHELRNTRDSSVAGHPSHSPSLVSRLPPHQIHTTHHNVNPTSLANLASPTVVQQAQIQQQNPSAANQSVHPGLRSNVLRQAPQLQEVYGIPRVNPAPIRPNLATANGTSQSVPIRCLCLPSCRYLDLPMCRASLLRKISTQLILQSCIAMLNY